MAIPWEKVSSAATAILALCAILGLWQLTILSRSDKRDAAIRRIDRTKDLLDLFANDVNTKYHEAMQAFRENELAPYRGPVLPDSFNVSIVLPENDESMAAIKARMPSVVDALNEMELFSAAYLLTTMRRGEALIVKESIFLPIAHSFMDMLYGLYDALSFIKAHDSQLYYTHLMDLAVEWDRRVSCNMAEQYAMLDGNEIAVRFGDYLLYSAGVYDADVEDRACRYRCRQVLVQANAGPGLRLGGWPVRMAFATEAPYCHAYVHDVILGRTPKDFSTNSGGTCAVVIRRAIDLPPVGARLLLFHPNAPDRVVVEYECGC